MLEGEGDIEGVMSTSEYFIEMAARVAARLLLVGPDAEAVRTCRHKGRFVRALERAGVNVAGTFEVASLPGLEQLAPRLCFPVVVKPVSGSGSVLMYGGGPGVVARQLSGSQTELRHDSDPFCRRTYCWIEAEHRRRSVVRALMAEATTGGPS